MRRHALLAACAMLAAAAPAAAQVIGKPSAADLAGRANLPQIALSKIILVGDSTVSVQSGWGGAFCDRHITSAIACIDLAREGRSTYSYRAQGLWKLALAEARAGAAYTATYVLIQFGHNDQPGKPGQSTDLASEYPDNLRGFVREVRAAGAIPVLVTPLARRQFTAGKLQDTLAPWAAAVRAVAQETGAPLVDLHARAFAELERLGPLAAIRFAQVPPPPEVIASAQRDGTVPPTVPAPPSTPAEAGTLAKVRRVFDGTHLGSEGADFFAGLVAAELAEAVPALRAGLVR